ncbi:unnamed protein product [Brassica oleracea]
MFRFEVMDPINKIERRRKEAETLVFWDINNCPVPKDCDAGLVGSCIESALKKAGHCKGDITIYAIIDIFYPSKPNRHLFRGLFSIGITVRRVSRGFVNAIDDLLTRNPKYPLTTGYIRCYARGERLEEKLRTLTLERRRTKIGETETLVLWDIDTCTVPKDCDARMVALGIESALKKAGVYGGPLTITAIGNLKYTSQLNPDPSSPLAFCLCHSPAVKTMIIAVY